MSTKLPQWIIYRLEMVYFDLATQRWQFFQNFTRSHVKKNYKDYTLGQHHRSYIEILLNSIKGTLKKVPKGTPFSVDFIKQRKSKKFMLFEKNEFLSLKEKSNVLLDDWSNFIDDIIKTAEDDKISDYKLKKFLNKTKNSFNAECDVDILPTVANRLLSLISIPAYWDLYGAMRYAWAKEEKILDPSLWQKIGRLSKPFCCTHLFYPSSNDTCEKVLDYPIDVEAIFCDLTAYDAKPTKIFFRDYFEYAYEPKGEELKLYKIYALFMDKLQKGLSLDKGDDHIYYLSYPIISSIGRKHFLNIYVKPKEITNSPISIEDLYEAWQQLHSQISWDDLNAMLVNECEQIDIIRFQKKVYADIENISTNTNPNLTTSDDTYNKCVRSVADYLYLLFPVEYTCFRGIDDKMYKKIGKYIMEDKKSFKIKWDKDSCKEDKECETCPSDEQNSGNCFNATLGLIKPISWGNFQIETRSHLQSKIINERLCRLLWQQMDYAHNVWNAFDQKRRTTYENNLNTWNYIKAVLMTNKPCVMNEVSKITTCNNTAIKEILNAQSLNLIKINIAEKLGLQNSPEDVGSKVVDIIEYLKINFIDEISKGSIYELISKYIETGIIKRLTHTCIHSATQNCLNPKEEYKKSKELINCVCKQYPALIKYLEGLNNVCDEHFNSIVGCTIDKPISTIRDVRKNMFRGFFNCESQNEMNENIKKFLDICNCCDQVYVNCNNIRLDLPMDFFHDNVWNEAVKSLRKITPSSSTGLSVISGIWQKEDSRIRDMDEWMNLNRTTIDTSIFIGVFLEDEQSNKTELPDHLTPMIQFLMPLGDVFWLVKKESQWVSKKCFSSAKAEHITEIEELSFMHNLSQNRNCELLKCKMKGFYIKNTKEHVDE